MKTRSHEDPIAIQQLCFDDKLKAMRMVFVGDNTEFIPNHYSNDNFQPITGPSNIPSPSPTVIKETEVKIVEVPTYIVQKEIQIERIEVPLISYEIREVVREVIKEVPGETKIEIKTIEIEKPVYITQTQVEYKDLPKSLVAFLVVNVACTLILSLLKFLK